MTIEKQLEVLNGITQIMHDSSHGKYEEMRCEFDHEVYEGGWSVGSKYSFVRNGLAVSELLDDPADRASDLVHQLHELMKSHPGGDWKSFTLAVDPSGKAKTNFT